MKHRRGDTAVARQGPSVGDAGMSGEQNTVFGSSTENESAAAAAPDSAVGIPHDAAKEVSV